MQLFANRSAALIKLSAAAKAALSTTSTFSTSGLKVKRNLFSSSQRPAQGRCARELARANGLGCVVAHEILDRGMDSVCGTHITQTMSWLAGFEYQPPPGEQGA